MSLQGGSSLFAEEIRLSSLHASALASLWAQYFPYELANGVQWDDVREQVADNILEVLYRYAPNMRGAILDRFIQTPLDLEREFGLTEGNIFQGELTLEQLFFARPVPGWANYTTPIRKLWMCGAATHPGGGIMGAPGRNAARRILGHTC